MFMWGIIFGADILSLNNPQVNDYIDYIYPEELEIYTIDAPNWDRYLDLRLGFDEDGRVYTRLNDKRDDWFPSSQFPIFK